MMRILLMTRPVNQQIMIKWFWKLICIIMILECIKKGKKYLHYYESLLSNYRKMTMILTGIMVLAVVKISVDERMCR